MGFFCIDVSQPTDSNSTTPLPAGAPQASAAAVAAPSAGSRKREAPPPGADGATAAPARKRGKRLPKGYDPAKPNGGLPLPDPERWLPKWQRADFKKKRSRRRDGQAVKGSQVVCSIAK